MKTGLAQSGDAGHCSATSLLRTMVATLQNGLHFPPTSRISSTHSGETPHAHCHFHRVSPCMVAVPHQLPAGKCCQRKQLPPTCSPPHCRGTPWVAQAFPMGHTHTWQVLTPGSLSNTSISSFFSNYCHSQLGWWISPCPLGWAHRGCLQAQGAQARVSLSPHRQVGSFCRFAV